MKPPKPAKTPELAAAETETIRCLDARDFVGAARAVAAYEANQPTPRGIGIDWANYRPDGDVVALTSIYSQISLATEDIRRAAALMLLWGCSKPYRRWLSREANGDALAKDLLFKAFTARQEAEYERAYKMFGIDLRPKRR